MKALKAFALILLLPSILIAQAQFGTIGGTIKDPTNAIIPGVGITIVNTATGQTTETVSGNDGRYFVPQLLPSTYEVQVAHPGFKSTTVKGLKLDINQNLSQDVILEIGGVTETISVEASAQRIETVSGATGHLIDNKQIDELPLNGRNVFDLVGLTPGSMNIGVDVSIGGGRTNSAGAMLDGVLNSRGGLGEQNIEMNPPVDTMQEFRVEVNAFSAQYGRSNAGIINATTKGGTNEFHGSLYEFVRNDILDSRGWNADEKAPLRRNQFGGTFGGPVIKNRTFFFYGLDAFVERRGVVRTRTVPLAEWRTGDLSTVQRSVSGAGQPLIIYDPETGQKKPFPGNIIPASRLDPVALKALSFVPLPNRNPDNPITQAGNWQENSSDPTDRITHTMRVDHSITDRTRVYARYILITPDNNNTGGTVGFGPADTDGLNLINRRQNVSLNLTHVISPKTFLSLRFGFGRVMVFRQGLGYGENWPQQLGVKGVEPDVFPRFNMSNGLVPTTNFGTPGNHNRRASFSNSEGHADFSMVRGSHTLKYGGSYIRFNGNELSRQWASGQFIFNTIYTRGKTAAGKNIPNTGMTFADFLLGTMNNVNVQTSNGNSRRSQYYAAYFEDSWKVVPNFTLTFGLRYELETPYYEVAGRMNGFDPYVPNPAAGTGDIPEGVMGVVTFPERNGYGRRLVNTDANNFAPRFGFNWRPFSSMTSIHGGFGVFYGNPYDRNAIQFGALGFDNNAVYRNPVPFTLREGLPPGAMDTPLESDLTPYFGTRGSKYPQSQIQWLDPRRRTQYNMNFNLTIEHQWRGLVFELGYIGNLGRKLTFANINLNHIPPDLLAQTEIPERLRRPYPQFDSNAPQIQIMSPNWGVGSYHAFNFKSEKRFSRGIGWIVTYTWSKAIDNCVSVGDTAGDNDQVQNIYDIKSEKSLGVNHIPHRLLISPILELPFGRGKPWLQSGPLSWIAGGWQLSGIVTIRSGAPFGITITNGPRDILGDNSNGTNLRPDLVGDINLPSNLQGTPAADQRGILWFNTDAFAAPALYTHGNLTRHFMLGPGRINFDTAISRNFRLREGYRLQFRWEAFNAFNTPQFGLPGSGMGSGGFGVASAGASDREMQFALRFNF